MDDAPARPMAIRRFSVSRLVEHWLGAAIVIVLALTGLAQKFNTNDFCQWLVLALGGIESARLIHRVCGSLLALLLVQHVVVASIGVGLRRWKPAMMISRKDFADLVANLKYYTGVTDTPARCERYCYNQKFEYWAILTGLVLMALTGFVLWYPTDITRFLPGEVIPAAKALHTNEALLIFLLIALWHVYNAMFSPEVFPLDTSIFTGTISLERMAHEHPLELARLQTNQHNTATTNPPVRPSAEI
jgi:formate dehydrogenase subunit gamma